MKTVNILGINFINATLKDFALHVTQRISNGKKTFIITANPEIVMYAEKNETYNKILHEADYITADGIGIVKAAALLNQPLPERVAGYDLMLEFLRVANSKRLKVYLLGAQAEVIEKTVLHIQSQYPNVKIVGHHHGFFDWKDASISNHIHETEPDFVFVALGVPRQELWIHENIRQFSKGVFIGIGGSFDVLAGNVKRAPVFLQKLNLEWLYRLIKQPTRWRRMMALPEFAIKVIIQKIKNIFH